jgi:hypothetical protein
MALGQQLGIITGKVATTRVLPPSAGLPSVEAHFEGTGQINGIDAQVMCTYWTRLRPDGTLYAQTDEQGVIVTGDGMTTYSGAAVGHMTPGGSPGLGAMYLHDPPGKLESLRDTPLAFEFTMDAEGNAQLVLIAWG